MKSRDVALPTRVTSNSRYNLLLPFLPLLLLPCPSSPLLQLVPSRAMCVYVCVWEIRSKLSTEEREILTIRAREFAGCFIIEFRFERRE